MKVLAADGLSFSVPIDSVAKIIDHFKRRGYIFLFRNVIQTATLDLAFALEDFDIVPLDFLASIAQNLRHRTTFLEL